LAESAGYELWTADSWLVKAVAAPLPWLKTPLNAHQKHMMSGTQDPESILHSALQGWARLSEYEPRRW
jgi:hypothetical protein